METKFNFKSSVCTSREQSERLLALGLKPETADMVWLDYSLYPDVEDWRICADYEDWGTWQEGGIPAWSLHRLIEMMPSVIYGHHRLDYYLNVNRDGVIYDRMGMSYVEFIYDNLFDNMILTIEWLIKEGYFNKEYLV